MDLYAEQQLRTYVIKDLMDAGGMGVVWRAWDQVRQEHVAIKAIASDLVPEPQFTTRFMDEARRHAILDHPNIVPVLDFFEEGNQNCLVMKMIEGMSLAGLLDSRQDHRLQTAEAIPILRDLLQALNYAHMKGIIHRDVKPSNVLLDNDQRAHLIDFGLALAIGEQRRTRTGQVVGTPHYMSPEQIIRPRSIDHRSDVYSLGCVFYEVLAGHPPFIADAGNVGDTDFAIKQAHVSTKPVAPKERVPDIPENIDRLIMLALEKDPDKRLPGCQEFLRQLDEFAKHPSQRRGNRRVYLALVIMGFVLLLLIGTLLSMTM